MGNGYKIKSIYFVVCVCAASQDDSKDGSGVLNTDGDVITNLTRNSTHVLYQNHKYVHMHMYTSAPLFVRSGESSPTVYAWPPVRRSGPVIKRNPTAPYR